MAWRPAPEPPDEQLRQAALRDLGWFSPHCDGLTEAAPLAALRALADAARRLCGCPVGWLTLVGADHACQVSAHDEDVPAVRTVPRAEAICAHAVAANAFLEVPDVRLDPRFGVAPGQLDLMCFYAAVPLRLQGHAVGTLCVASPHPHRMDDAQRQQLAQLAVAAEALIATQHAREHLDRERRRLSDLARASGDWLWELDAELCHRWLSDDFERLAGLPVSALIGQPLVDEPCVDAGGEPVPSGATLLTRMAARQPLTRVVTRFDTPHRGALYISRSAVPVFGEQGQFEGWRGSARDVSAQILATRETRERDLRMHKLMAQLPGAAFQLRLEADGTDPHYLYVNDGVRVLLGDGGQTPSLRRVAAEDRAALVEAVLESIRQLTPMRVEFRFQRDGEPRWLETRATPERQADGRIVFHGFTWDVTERRQAQDALREHEALRLAHDSAERASRAKSEFLSRVSHELRTPLNAIIGFAQLMGLDREQPLISAQRHRLDGVRQAGQALLTLVDDVLDLSRIEQGTLTLRNEALSLTELLRSSIEAVQPLAVARSVSIRLVVPAGARVQGDPAALEQVLVNLLSNAIKYNRSGGRVTVTLQESTMAPGVAQVTICDQGEGLRPDQLAQLFQPFNRLGAERRRISGTGLGLVIARGLARAMGGDIEARSEPGRGSCFALKLMASAQAGGAVAPSADSQSGPQSTDGATRRVVLYVEDEPLNVLLMEEVFRTQPGWTLHVAHDGGSGVDRATELRPDLALIDMNLPDMNGLEVLRRLRAQPETADLLCVALSADAMNDQIAAALAAGFDDYWTKPIDLNRLIEEVRRVIDARRAFDGA
ncbi:ATP-binding protein [Ideonella sp. DXS29W]|uniref:histidine kinase n=1 Tax=Ideonella lacteola TaxID=2984193 RepID=A0ABU9BXD6_9BURK